MTRNKHYIIYNTLTIIKLFKSLANFEYGSLVYSKKLKYFRYISFLIFISFFLTSCATAPYTDRNQLILTSENEEIQLGQKAWQETLSNNTISRNSQYNAALKRVGTKLAKATDKKKL